MELSEYFINLKSDLDSLQEDMKRIVMSKGSSEETKKSEKSENKEDTDGVTKKSLQPITVLRPMNFKPEEDKDVQFVIDQINHIFKK